MIPTIKRLVSGGGDPAKGEACWMSMLAYWDSQSTGDPLVWTDKAKCISPAIRRMCIALNDGLDSDEARQRVILSDPSITFAPYGTRDDEAEPRRVAFLLDCARRKYVPFAFRCAADALSSAIDQRSRIYLDGEDGPETQVWIELWETDNADEWRIE